MVFHTVATSQSWLVAGFSRVRMLPTVVKGSAATTLVAVHGF